MAPTRARYPQLVKLGDPPTIMGQQCAQCGRRAFPPDPYGCEACGATVEALTPTELAATGRIRAVATVHRHHHAKPETPFTVATIVLDDGIALKGVLASSDTGSGTGGGSGSCAGGDVVGARVIGVTVVSEVDDDGTEVVDLRFEVEVSAEVEHARGEES